MTDQEKTKFNRDLRHELTGLELDGSNIESYYNKRLGEFLLYNSELTLKQKIEATLIMMSTPLDEDKMKDFRARNPIRDRDKDDVPVEEALQEPLKEALLESTFVKGQITRAESYIGSIDLNDRNRQKLNFWLDYLKQRATVYESIQPPVPEWTQPLIALYLIYTRIGYSEKTIPDICKKLGYEKGWSEIKDKYFGFREAGDRTFSNMELGSEKQAANAQLKRLTDLKVIMESRGEKDKPQYDFLLSDIDQLEKNLRYKI